MLDAFLRLYGEPTGLLQIVLLSGIMGGACAWLTGRAIATTWRPIWHVVASMILLGAALRFLHFALLESELLNGAAYVLDTVFLVVVALAAFRRTRALQMSRQYYWLYETEGPFGWRRRPDAVESSAQD